MTPDHAARERAEAWLRENIPIDTNDEGDLVRSDVDAILTFAADAARRENAECEQLALELGSRAEHSGWTADAIAHLIRARHAGPGPE